MYGCAGALYSVRRSACSTTEPLYITATCVEMARTTDKSWAMHQDQVHVQTKRNDAGGRRDRHFWNAAANDWDVLLMRSATIRLIQ